MDPRHPLPELTDDERLRYARHLMLPEMGEEGQRRLKAGSALIVGVGGLGSPAALYLAAAGVGRLGLVDFDLVDASNLQRQVLHGTSRIGTPKLVSARERLLDLNPSIEVDLHETRLEASNALEVLAPYDVVLDGSDNFPTRYLVNDACALLGKPDVHGSIFRFEGHASVFDARLGPCYRCLYPEPPAPGVVPSCAEAGVLGVLPGIIGTMQAIEAVKLLLGLGEPLIGRLVVFDALGMRFREMRLRKDPACPLCGERPTIAGLIDYEVFCGTTPGAPAAAGAAGATGTGFAWERGLEIDPTELRALLASGEPPALLDVREPWEHAIARIEPSTLIPLGTLPGSLNRLDPERPLVLYCHHGNRSLHAVEFLRQMGFRRLKSLRGGVESWSREIDPSMRRY
jgi:adenylyltransferase/sulfurtransferase